MKVINCRFRGSCCIFNDDTDKVLTQDEINMYISQGYQFYDVECEEYVSTTEVQDLMED